MSNFPLYVSSRELVGLFLFLRSKEDELDSTLDSLHQRLSDLLYQQLSIDQMEKLQHLYDQKIDVLE